MRAALRYDGNMLSRLMLSAAMWSACGAQVALARGAPADQAPAPPPLLAKDPPTPAPTRVYTLVVLRKGPVWTADETPAVKALLEQHMANIRRLGTDGKLLAAGPCGDGDLRGIFVFATESLDEARSLAASDPAVKAGRLRALAYRFMGTPGIGRGVAAARAKAGGTSAMVRYHLALARFGAHYKPEEQNENRALFMARNTWLQRAQAAGQLALAGPFLGGDLVGLLVLRADSPEAAQGILAGDPALVTHRFAYEVTPLWLERGTLE